MCILRMFEGNFSPDAAHVFLLPGFGFEEDASWFPWHKDYKFSTADHTFEVDLIPKLNEQGIDVKLGIH